MGFYLPSFRLLHKITKKVRYILVQRWSFANGTLMKLLDDIRGPLNHCRACHRSAFPGHRPLL